MSELYRAPVGGASLEAKENERLGRSIVAYLDVFFRRSRLFLGLPCTVAALVGIVSLLTPRQYVASATFVPQELATPQIGLGQLASQFGFSLPQVSSTSLQFYA